MSEIEVQQKNFINGLATHTSTGRISVGEVMRIFKAYGFKPKNYPSIAKNFLLWLSENQVILNEFSAKVYFTNLAGKVKNLPAYKTPVYKLLKVAKEQKIIGFFVYQETEAKPMLESALEAYFEAFLQYSQRNKSLRTKQNYRNSFREFCKFCQIQDLSEFSHVAVQRFRSYLMVEKETGKKSAFTVNAYLSPLRQFSKYLILNSDSVFANLEQSKVLTIERDLDKISLIQGDTIEAGQYFKDSLEHHEVLQVIQALPGSREKLIVGLMYFAGLRTFEVLKVELKDFNRKAQELNTIGKGGKKATIRLTHCFDSIDKLLTDYLKEHKPNQDGQLFPTLNHTSQIRRFVNEALTKLDLKAKSKKVSCHSFRHSLAQNLIKSGLPVEAVQEILRHNNIGTTEIYFKKLQSEKSLKIPANILSL